MNQKINITFENLQETGMIGIIFNYFGKKKIKEDIKLTTVICSLYLLFPILCLLNISFLFLQKEAQVNYFPACLNKNML